MSLLTLMECQQTTPTGSGSGSGSSSSSGSNDNSSVSVLQHFSSTLHHSILKAQPLYHGKDLYNVLSQFGDDEKVVEVGSIGISNGSGSGSDVCVDNIINTTTTTSNGNINTNNMMITNTDNDNDNHGNNDNNSDDDEKDNYYYNTSGRKPTENQKIQTMNQASIQVS